MATASGAARVPSKSFEHKQFLPNMAARASGAGERLWRAEQSAPRARVQPIWRFYFTVAYHSFFFAHDILAAQGVPVSMNSSSVHQLLARDDLHDDLVAQLIERGAAGGLGFRGGAEVQIVHDGARRVGLFRHIAGMVRQLRVGSVVVEIRWKNNRHFQSSGCSPDALHLAGAILSVSVPSCRPRICSGRTDLPQIWLTKG